MNKKTKMLLGVGVVAAAAYYFWSKSKKDDTAAPKASANGKFVKRTIPYGSQYNRATDISGVEYYVPR